MTREENVALVKEIYGAIAQGVRVDIPGPDVIPFCGSYRGAEGVGEFFRTLGTSAEVLAFEPREFIAQGDKVVALGHERLEARSTGRTWATEWAMAWAIQDGEVTSLREFHETGNIAAAFDS